MSKIKKRSKPSPVNKRLIAFGDSSDSSSHKVNDSRSMACRALDSFYNSDVQLASSETRK